MLSAEVILAALLSSMPIEQAVLPARVVAFPAPVTPEARGDSAATPTSAAEKSLADLGLEELMEITVVTPSRKQESIRQAPAIVDVLTRQQLYDLGARNLYEALSYLPGIVLTETYGGRTVLVFRGMAQDQYSVNTLLLINGHPSYEPVAFAYQLELIPIEAIERIEVIRGPGSVLYGTNAIAGVINVITVAQESDDNTTLMRAQGGQFATGQAGGGNYGRSGDLAWSLFAGGQAMKGYPYRVRNNQNEDCVERGPVADQQLPPPAECTSPGSRAGQFPMFQNYVNTYGSIRYGGFNFQAGGLLQETQKYGFIPSLRFHGTDENTHVFGELSYTKAWPRLRLISRVGLTRAETTWNIGRFPLPVFPESEVQAAGTIYRGEVTLKWDALQTLSLDQGISYELLTGGTETLLENGENHPLTPELTDIEQRTASWYTQANWSLLPTLSVVGGYRLSRFQSTHPDLSDLAEGELPRKTVLEAPHFLHSPRAGLVYQPTEEISLKALYGEAFRLPTPFEKHAVFLGVIAPLADVEPESIRTGELSIEAQPHARLTTRLSGHYSQLENLIDRRLPASAEELALLGGAESGGLYDNFLRAEIYGAELTSQYSLQRSLDAFANVTWTRAHYEPMHPDHQEIGTFRRPLPAEWTTSGGLSWRAAKWLRLHPHAQYVGARGYASAYILANGVADFLFWDPLRVSFIANNIFDERYEFPEYVRRYVKTIPGGPGRALYGRLLYEF